MALRMALRFIFAPNTFSLSLIRYTYSSHSSRCTTCTQWSSALFIKAVCGTAASQ